MEEMVSVYSGEGTLFLRQPGGACNRPLYVGCQRKSRANDPPPTCSELDRASNLHAPPVPAGSAANGRLPARGQHLDRCASANCWAWGPLSPAAAAAPQISVVHCIRWSWWGPARFLRRQLPACIALACFSQFPTFKFAAGSCYMGRWAT
jgi:hypothetical protein